MSEIIASQERREEYQERKSKVLDLLEKAKEFYENDGQAENASVFEKLHKDLLNGEFSIVVVGEFSAGKSTLLNALMGERILPSFSNETTATVNFLRHSEKAQSGEAGRVFYNDGTEEVLKDATLENITKFVSTKGDQVAQKVDHLDLYIDSEFLKDGVTLVDSPGLNGVADNHREITEEQILKSHASIFVFSSDHPGSNTDFEFLHDLQSKVKTIIFVLNKIDQIKEDEGETPESVVRTLKQSYKKKFPEEKTVPEIWPVAAYPALVARNREPLSYHEIKNRTPEEKKQLEEDSGLKKFEDRLMRFLTCGEKAKEQLLSPVDRVLKLAMNTCNEYQQEIQLLENSTDSGEINEQIAKIKESKEQVEKQIEGSRRKIKTDLNETLRDQREALAAEMERLKKKKLSEIDRFDNWDELISYRETFENDFKKSVERKVFDLERDLRDGILNQIQMQYTSQAEELEEQFAESNVNIDLSLNNHLDIKGQVFEIGLQQMKEKEETLKKKLEDLKKEAEKAETAFDETEKHRKEYKKLSGDLEDYKKKEEMIRNQVLPSTYHYTQQVTKKVERGGILGSIQDVLFGAKDLTVYEDRVDSKAYDDAKRIRDQELDDISKKKKDKEREMDKLGAIDYDDVERMKKKYVKKEGEVNEARRELEELTTRNKQRIEEEYKKEVAKIKRNLDSYCETISDELNYKVKTILRQQEKNYVGIIIDMVESSLKYVLKEKQERLEQLQTQLQSSEEQRNERVERLKQKVSQVQELMGEAKNMQIELEDIPVDQIERESM